MMAKRSIYILIILCIICLFFISILIIKTKRNNNENINIDNTLYQNDLSIEQIKNELGYIADSNLYSIDTEYDGRKVLNIKHDLQYMVAFAGLIKTEDLKTSEVEDIFKENYPKQCGIWIENSTREKISELINKSTNSKYIINENDVILEKLINSNKTIVLTINSYYYEIGNVTGEINKYPFEQLDEYQPLDMIKNENNILIVLSSNKNNKLTEKQILDELYIVLKENI